VNLDTASGNREGIPADYATEMLVVINALNDMKQDHVEWDAGTRGIGVLVSDTMMFQRAAPSPSDEHLSSFYGLSLPLLKAGVPVEPVQLETILTPGALDRYRMLLLTYEGQKPLRREYHERLSAWVRAGGTLLYVGDGSDPYDDVREWWNEMGAKQSGPAEDLFAQLGLLNGLPRDPVAVDKGWVRILTEKPRELASRPGGADTVLAAVDELLARQGEKLRKQKYLKLKRGPYVVVAVLDEMADAQPLTLDGRYVNLFDPSLEVVQNPTFQPGTRALLFDLDSPCDDKSRIIAAAGRVRDVRADDKGLSCSVRGPLGAHCRLRVQCAAEPKRIAIEPTGELKSSWDAPSRTTLIEFDNRGESVSLKVEL
jgi:hypothetical protein